MMELVISAVRSYCADSTARYQIYKELIMSFEAKGHMNLDHFLRMDPAYDEAYADTRAEGEGMNI